MKTNSSFRHLLVALSAIVLAGSAGADEEVSEQQAFAEHAASCAAYYFSAARAKGVREYETLYGAGEYCFNLAVTAADESIALQHFNQASTHINHVMQKRWTDFHKVDEQYALRCEKLFKASQQAGNDARGREVK